VGVNSDTFKADILAAGGIGAISGKCSCGISYKSFGNKIKDLDAADTQLTAAALLLLL
jgi:hypothetical protein